MSKTSTIPAIRRTPKRAAAANQWLAAKAAADAAQEALAQARSALLSTLPRENGQPVTGALSTDSGTVVVAIQNRSKFDVDLLATLVDEETFASVTQAVVVPELWDAQVLTGGIGHEVEDAVVTPFPVVALSRRR